MPTGLQTINDDGVTVLDGNYQNLVLRQVITATAAAGDNNALPSSGNRDLSGRIWIKYTGTRPMLFCTGVFSIVIEESSGNVFYWAIRGGSQFYIFDVTENNAPNEGSGIRLWDGNGNTMFTSAERGLRVTGVLPFRLDSLSSDGYYANTVTGSFPGAKLAVCQNTRRVTQPHLATDAVRIQGNSVSIVSGGNIARADLDSSGNFRVGVMTGQVQLYALVADVSGL